MISDLGRRLIADLAARSPDQNILVSPVSIGMALSLLAGGAAGKTRAAILAALGSPGANQEQLDQSCQKLVKQLSGIDPEYAEELEFGGIPDREPAARADLANGLWLSRDISFLPDFADKARRNYQAHVSGADFTADETIEIVNAWVSERTQGNIDQMVHELNPQTSLVLINAVYFKGAWSTPFKTQATEEAPFTLPDGSQIACDLMYQSTDLPYAETETFQLVMLPIAGARLGRREGAHLAVALPRPGKTCAEVLEALGENWMASLAREGVVIQEVEVELWLPRFRITYNTSLTNTLQALGMEVAFSEQADFSGIATTPTRITDVQHKTTLLVNERGAEASAATRAVMASFGAVARSPLMRVDRPFVCGIVLGWDLTPLFLGVINRPERTDPA